MNTSHFYTPCGTYPRPCVLLTDNHDGTFNVRPSGWSQGHQEIDGDQLYTPDEVTNTGNDKADFWKTKDKLNE